MNQEGSDWLVMAGSDERERDGGLWCGLALRLDAVPEAER